MYRLSSSVPTCMFILEVYVLRENKDVVSLNKVNCSSVIPKGGNEKWDRIASEVKTVLVHWIYLHEL